MELSCVWEHNGGDTLLYAVELPGAYARGESLEAALTKMEREVRSYLLWRDGTAPDAVAVTVAQEAACELTVSDADSDVLFDAERPPLTRGEYKSLKALALRSAADFLALYKSVPDPDRSVLPPRRTFYGAVPRTAREMLAHTQSVNSYYFAEIGVDADNGGTILSCRRAGFDALERQQDFLSNPVFDGSYGESWTLRKLLRRFLWHDRIHARALLRMADRTFGPGTAADPFRFRQP